MTCYDGSDDEILLSCVKDSSQKMQKKMRLYGCGDHLSERWVRFGAAWAMRERSILPVVEP